MKARNYKNKYLIQSVIEIIIDILRIETTLSIGKAIVAV
jgi:hypothetical protein